MGKIIDRVRQRQADLERKERARRGAELNRDLMRTISSTYGGGDFNARGIIAVAVIAAAMLIGATVGWLKGGA